MAGPLGKSMLEDMLLQAKSAAITMHDLRDRLLQLHLRLSGPAGDGTDAARLRDEVLDGLTDQYVGLEAVARQLTTGLMFAASNGVAPSLPVRFSVISNEQLCGEMLALRLPERPTTQSHACDLLQAAFYAVKLPQDHLNERCCHHLLLPAPDMDQARTYLGRACTFADLAVTHIDLAVTAIEGVIDDPEKVATMSSLAEHFALKPPYR